MRPQVFLGGKRVDTVVGASKDKLKALVDKHSRSGAA